MVNGIYVKCRNCHKKFYVEIKLNFGVREKRDVQKLLNCLLDSVRFYFKCPYCKNDSIVGVEFFSDKPPEIAQITENPDYIG